MERVAVIGAGVSGIVTAKTLLEHNFEPVIFEKKKELGGLWFYNTDLPDGDSPAYRSLRTNTSKYTYAYSDMPMADEIPDYPHWSDVHQYLCNYADKHDLRQYIQFNTHIKSINREADGWLITTDCDGTISNHQFKRIIVCSGRYNNPVIPHFDGQETFTGDILHSLDYDNPEPFRGQRVLVVGASSSAVDMAAEVGQVASKVIMSARKLGLYFPNITNNRPADFSANRLTLNLPTRLLGSVIRSVLKKSYEKMGIDFDKFTWYQGKIDFTKSRGAVNTPIIHALNDETVIAKEMFTHIEGSDVIFPDGSRETIDTILLGTGFVLKYPFLPDDLFDEVAGDLGLYLHIFHPDDETIAFVGTAGGAGAFPPVAELQARCIVAVWSDDFTLPPKNRMKRDIQKRQTDMIKNETHPMVINFTQYTTKLAKLIGAAPNYWKNRNIFKALLTGPIIAAHYRLNDPKTKAQAQTEIERIFALKQQREAEA